jgi:hypothetical protein
MRGSHTEKTNKEVCTILPPQNAFSSFYLKYFRKQIPGFFVYQEISVVDEACFHMQGFVVFFPISLLFIKKLFSPLLLSNECHVKTAERAALCLL